MRAILIQMAERVGDRGVIYSSITQTCHSPCFPKHEPLGLR